MRNRKAECGDGILAEVLNTDVDVTASILQPILEQIWNTERTPAFCKEEVLGKLLKQSELRNEE